MYKFKTIKTKIYSIEYNKVKIHVVFTSNVNNVDVIYTYMQIIYILMSRKSTFYLFNFLVYIWNWKYWSWCKEYTNQCKIDLCRWIRNNDGAVNANHIFYVHGLNVHYRRIHISVFGGYVFLFRFTCGFEFISMSYYLNLCII